MPDIQSQPQETPKRGRPPGRGRPPAKTKGHYNISLDLDLIEWLKNHPDGPAAVAARALRREMERDK